MTGPELIIKKRARGKGSLRCTGPKCGSKRLHYYRENTHYRAYKCHECGEFVVEGNIELFEKHETAINHARMQREMERERREDEYYGDE
jgi:NAD-dependent SIR2 family protein deacetylase